MNWCIFYGCIFSVSISAEVGNSHESTEQWLFCADVGERHVSGSRNLARSHIHSVFCHTKLFLSLFLTCRPLSLSLLPILTMCIRSDALLPFVLWSLFLFALNRHFQLKYVDSMQILYNKLLTRTKRWCASFPRILLYPTNLARIKCAFIKLSIFPFLLNLSGKNVTVSIFEFLKFFLPNLKLCTKKITKSSIVNVIRKMCTVSAFHLSTGLKN